MHRIAFLAALLASGAAFSGPAYADAFLGLHYGLSALFADELKDADLDQASVAGIQIFGSQDGSHIAGEFSYWRSKGDGRIEPQLLVPSVDIETDLRLSEVALGLGYQGGADGKSPWYLGAGVSAVRAELEVEGGGDADETSIGAYLTAMIRRRTGEHFSLGLSARFLFFAELEGVDLDCAQATVFAAFGK